MAIGSLGDSSVRPSNLAVSSVKLKGKILPRDPYVLQVEVLIRRSFTGGDDDAYERLLEEWQAAIAHQYPALDKAGVWTSDRDVRFAISNRFTIPVLDASDEKVKFEWLATAMSELWEVFEPLVRQMHRRP